MYGHQTLFTHWHAKIWSQDCYDDEDLMFNDPLFRACSPLRLPAIHSLAGPLFPPVCSLTPAHISRLACAPLLWLLRAPVPWPTCFPTPPAWPSTPGLPCLSLPSYLLSTSPTRQTCKVPDRALRGKSVLYRLMYAGAVIQPPHSCSCIYMEGGREGGREEG